MKTSLAIAAFAFCSVLASHCLAESPQIGAWKLNPARSKLPSWMSPTNQVTYTAAGDQVKVEIHSKTKEGKPIHSVWLGKFDGKFHPVKGNPLFDAAMYKPESDHVLEITTQKAGKTFYSGKITVSKDGKSRVVTINTTNAAGKKERDNAYYDKL